MWFCRQKRWQSYLICFIPYLIALVLVSRPSCRVNERCTFAHFSAAQPIGHHSSFVSILNLQLTGCWRKILPSILCCILCCFPFWSNHDTSDTSLVAILLCSCACTYSALQFRWCFTCEGKLIIDLNWTISVSYRFRWTIVIILGDKEVNGVNGIADGQLSVEKRWKRKVFRNTISKFRLMVPCIIGNFIFVLGQVSNLLLVKLSCNTA